jgi:type IV pilus assembly protein PilB
MAQRKLLGQILLEMKAASPVQIKEALKKQMEDSGRKLGEILVEMKAINSRQLVEALARQFNYPFVDLKKVKIDAAIISLVPRNVCDEHSIVPIRENGKAIVIAISDPLDFFTLDNVKFILGREVNCVLATKADIEDAVNRHYGTKEKSAMSEAIEQATVTQTEIKIRGDELMSQAKVVGEEDDDAPVIKFVQLMIADAIKMRASDIHVEPMEDRVRVRFRVDGVCQEVNAAPKRLQGSLIQRVKIMADMDISEKRKPQDGRIKINAAGRDLDIRASALPSIHGESIVMRLLDKQAGLLHLEDMGFHPADYKRFRTIIKRPNGIVLVTGPTGSGKTTTLYAALSELNRPDVKIITAENPVEYNLSGINQAQVRAQIGMTFSRILRAMLRQAPNIILVGEIRDKETAEIAIQAALTGHLVFSTLHTNDAPGALARLLDIGIKPFLVASAVQAIMGQRLIRMLCPKCKEPNNNPDPVMLSALDIKPEQLRGKQIYRPVGCDGCRNTGYKGRKGIFELLEMDGVMRDMVFKKESHQKLKDHARLRGMVTLLEDGVRKVLDGLTSLDEVVAITHREDISY